MILRLLLAFYNLHRVCSSLHYEKPASRAAEERSCCWFFSDQSHSRAHNAERLKAVKEYAFAYYGP